MKAAHAPKTRPPTAHAIGTTKPPPPSLSPPLSMVVVVVLLLLLLAGTDGVLLVAGVACGGIHHPRVA